MAKPKVSYWTERNVFITGVTGFVGSWLAEKLIELNANVYGLVRRRSVPNVQNIKHIQDKIKLIPGDLLDHSSIQKALEENGINTVFHLAAQSYVPQSFNAPVDTYMSNIIGTANVLEAIRMADKTDITGMTFTGSSEEYGLVKENEIPINESNPLRPLSPYGVSKVACDMMCYAHNKAYGIPVVRTRAFNHTGPRRGEVFITSVVTKQVVQAKKTGAKELIIGNPDPIRDFSDVRDIVDGYMLAVELGKRGSVYNFASGVGLTIRQLCEKAIKVGDVDMKIKIDKARYRPADVMVLIGNATKAKTELGWEPTIPFEKTLKDMIAYWIERTSFKY